jgi:hypothetical protein
MDEKLLDETTKLAITIDFELGKLLPIVSSYGICSKTVSDLYDMSGELICKINALDVKSA